MSIETLVAECQTEIFRIKESQCLLHRYIRWVSMLRLLLFLMALLSICFYIAGQKAPLLPVISVVGFMLFLVLVKYHTRLYARYSYDDIRLSVCRSDLAHLSEDYSKQRNGAKYVNTAHDYAYDIDLYGQNSLFQMINRTCSDVGSRQLADLLEKPLTEAKAICEQQQLLQKLATDGEFLTRFRVEMLSSAAEDYQTNGNKGEETLLSLDNVSWKTWASQPNSFAGKWMYHLLIPFAACINLLVWGAAIGDAHSYSQALLVTVLFATIASVFTARITRKQQEFSHHLRTLSLMAPAIGLIEQMSLLNLTNTSASSTIRRLRKLMDALDRRNNVLLLFLLNGLFFWEIHQMIRLERWKRTYAARIPSWINALAKADAYVSMALFVRHHPNYTWPRAKESDKDFIYKATALSHPLMKQGTCVANPIEIVGSPFFLVITGANMAGKSTYLRTISVNYLLACVGLPVCGERMTFTPARLLTSLRTTDSLSNGESYFFAELKRMKLIIDSLKAGERLFIVLDEILRGTNSVDKQKGSLALLKQLIHLQTNGIIATHDLLLGTLADHYPTHVRNHCFEADIQNNQLTFPYRLRPGIAQNMNACFLMQQMGIGNGEW